MTKKYILLLTLFVSVVFAQSGQLPLRNIMTTKGDTIVSNGTDAVRLPVCEDNVARVADSTQPSGWRCGGTLAIGATVLESNLTATTAVLSVPAETRTFGTAIYTLPACTYTITAGTGSGLTYLWISDSGQEVLLYPNAGSNAITAAGGASCATQGVVVTTWPTGYGFAPLATVQVNSGQYGTVTPYEKINGGWYPLCGGNLACSYEDGTATIDTGANVMTLNGTNPVTGAVDLTQAQSFTLPISATDPATCKVGSKYLNSTRGFERTCTATDTWNDSADDVLDTSSMKLVEEFTPATVTNGAIGTHGWTWGKIAGTNSPVYMAVTDSPKVGNHPGVAKVNTASGVTDDFWFGLYQVNYPADFGSPYSGTSYFQWIFRVSGSASFATTPTSGKFFCGIGGTGNTTWDTGLLYDPTIDVDHWLFVTNAGAGITASAASTIPLSASWLKLTVAVNPTTGTTFTLTDWDTSTTSTTTITSVKLSTVSSPMCKAWNTIAASNWLLMDRFAWDIQGLAR